MFHRNNQIGFLKNSRIDNTHCRHNAWHLWRFGVHQNIFPRSAGCTQKNTSPTLDLFFTINSCFELFLIYCRIKKFIWALRKINAFSNLIHDPCEPCFDAITDALTPSPSSPPTSTPISHSRPLRDFSERRRWVWVQIVWFKKIGIWFMVFLPRIPYSDAVRVKVLSYFFCYSKLPKLSKSLEIRGSKCCVHFFSPWKEVN